MNLLDENQKVVQSKDVTPDASGKWVYTFENVENIMSKLVKDELHDYRRSGRRVYQLKLQDMTSKLVHT